MCLTCFHLIILSFIYPRPLHTGEGPGISLYPECGIFLKKKTKSVYDYVSLICLCRLIYGLRDVNWKCGKLPPFLPFINPRHTCEGYSSHFISVCVCVCYHADCYVPGLYIENKVPLDILWHFQEMNCVNFVENALFKRFGNIC